MLRFTDSNSAMLWQNPNIRKKQKKWGSPQAFVWLNSSTYEILAPNAPMVHGGKKNTKKKTGGLQTPAVSNSTELTLFYGPTLLFRVIGSGVCTDHCYQWLWLFLLSFIYAHCFWPTSEIFRFLIHILHIPSNSVKIGWHTENQLDQLSGPKFTIYNQ